MYSLLRERIEQSKIALADYAQELGVTASEFDDKLGGEKEFTFDEAVRLRELMGSTLPIESLFKK